MQIYGSKAFAVMAVANDNFNDMWSGRLKATSKNISNVRVSLVLSYCFGDLSWLKGYTNGFLFDRTFVAVKCGHQPDLDALPENSTLMPLPNVGGNDHTMAYWMSEVLPTLPKAYDSDDAVLFLKDSMKSPWFIRDFKSLLEITLSDQAFGCVTEAPFPMSFYSNLKFLRMFYLEGYARSSNIASFVNSSATDVLFKSQYDTLGDWHQGIGITLRGPYVPACYCGMFMVKRSRIESVPKGLLRNMTLNLARGNNIEEGHFAERTWASLLMDELSLENQLLLRERTKSIELRVPNGIGTLMM